MLWRQIRRQNAMPRARCGKACSRRHPANAPHAAPNTQAAMARFAVGKLPRVTASTPTAPAKVTTQTVSARVAPNASRRVMQTNRVTSCTTRNGIPTARISSATRSDPVAKMPATAQARPARTPSRTDRPSVPATWG